MKKRFLAALLSLCMTLTLLPTTAFAALSDSLGNTLKENQAILEQLSALTGGSSDQVRSVLNALGLLDEAGNFKVDQTITLDGQVLTLAAVMELLENPATDLTRIADVDGTPGLLLYTAENRSAFPTAFKKASSASISTMWRSR